MTCTAIQAITVLKSLVSYSINGAQPSDFPAFCDINAREVERFSVSCLAVAVEECRAVAEVCSLFPAARTAEAGRKRNKADRKGRCNGLLDSCS